MFGTQTHHVPDPRFMPRGTFPELFLYDTDLDEFNLELAEEILAHIEAHPEEHHQDTWFLGAADDVYEPPCQTAACIAGHVAIRCAGTDALTRFVWTDRAEVPDRFRKTRQGKLFASNMVRVQDGDHSTTEMIPDYARHQLGLGRWDADQLFRGAKQTWQVHIRQWGEFWGDFGHTEEEGLASNEEAIEVLRFYIQEARRHRDGKEELESVD